MADPPPLPPGLDRMTTVLVVGTGLWLLAAVVVAVVWLAAGRPLDLVFLTCVVGAALGGLGYSVFAWQRAAARRGSRTAQQGVS